MNFIDLDIAVDGDGDAYSHHGHHADFARAVPVRRAKIQDALRHGSVTVLGRWLESRKIESVYALKYSELGERVSAFGFAYHSGPPRSGFFVVTLFINPTVTQCAFIRGKPRVRARVDEVNAEVLRQEFLRRWVRNL